MTVASSSSLFQPESYSLYVVSLSGQPHQEQRPNREERNVSSWHEADIEQRPLFGRYGVESGHHRLIVSISAYDPRRTSLNPAHEHVLS
jgi:hypothetical protein